MSVPFQSAFYNPGQFAPSEGSWYNTPYGTLARQQNLPQAFYAYGRQQGIPDDQSVQPAVPAIQQRFRGGNHGEPLHHY
jgi:hypothetical protein